MPKMASCDIASKREMKRNLGGNMQNAACLRQYHCLRYHLKHQWNLTYPHSPLDVESREKTQNEQVSDLLHHLAQWLID